MILETPTFDCRYFSILPKRARGASRPDHRLAGFGVEGVADDLVAGKLRHARLGNDDAGVVAAKSPRATEERWRTSVPFWKKSAAKPRRRIQAPDATRKGPDATPSPTSTPRSRHRSQPGSYHSSAQEEFSRNQDFLEVNFSRNQDCSTNHFSRNQERQTCLRAALEDLDAPFPPA